MSRLDRLLRPRSFAVIGGGVWCANIIAECRKIGFDGTVWAVHPTKAEIAGVTAYPSVRDLPAAPDAVFVGVNREASIEIARDLAAIGAGGAVFFASGFKEAQGETGNGAGLQEALIAAAGDMPFLGPNCYGFVNALDRVAVWPDQHGLIPVERGVAIITQSSNMAINLSMQARGLPIAALATVGNQAVVDITELGMALLEDTRITALGLHIEGISNLRGFEALAAKADALGKPIVALKVGASDEAQAATVSHTASLAGSFAGAQALLRRLGMAQVGSLSVMLEAMKIAHVTGWLPHNRIASMSCSGGEASLMADLGAAKGVRYPALTQVQRTGLSAALGPKVALANPLDYHTYIWGDQAAIAQTFTAMMAGDLSLGVVVLDFPRPDRCDGAAWDIVIDACTQTQEASGKPMAILASIGDTMFENIAQNIMDKGLIPLEDMGSALEAVSAMASRQSPSVTPLWEPRAPLSSVVMSEAEAKEALAEFGLSVPQSSVGATPQEIGRAARTVAGRLVLKGMGAAHKSEAGFVRLGLLPDEVEEAALQMGAAAYLVEEMIEDAVAELLVGITCDPAHGYVLTLGAGGVLTEILRDTAQLLLPTTPGDIRAALGQLKIAPLLHGYRGKPAADIEAIVASVEQIIQAMEMHLDSWCELEVNPLLCRPHGAVAVDALIQKGESQ